MKNLEQLHNENQIMMDSFLNGEMDEEIEKLEELKIKIDDFNYRSELNSLLDIFNDIEDILENKDNFSVNIDGVYCRWSDSYFIDKEEAIEVLREDESAIYAAFSGYISFEDRPYIENYNNNYISDISFNYDFEGCLNSLEEIKELCDNFDLSIDSLCLLDEDKTDAIVIIEKEILSLSVQSNATNKKSKSI